MRRFFGSCASNGLVRVARLACLSTLLVACSERAPGDAVATEGAAIVGGVPSPAEEDFVVLVRTLGLSTCTGTLIAPNAVLTALHCVSEFDPLAPFLCNNDGTVAPSAPGGGALGSIVPAEEVEISNRLRNVSASKSPSFEATTKRSSATG